MYCMRACECRRRLRKLTLQECPLQSEDFRVGCVFMGAFWQEEAGTRSRITEQHWNVVQRGISWVKHKAAVGSWGGALRRKTFISCIIFNIKTDDAQCTALSSGWRRCTRMRLRLAFVWFLSFHTTTKLEDHVPWNISQTCDSFTENLHPNVRASTVAVLESQWMWSVSISLQAVH